jgi:ABC-type nitrate/sulfonate/bicarbonate transport system substrate-binding protein
MKRQLASVLMAIAIGDLFSGASYGAEALQKIRVGVPSLALSYMPLYVAQERGFLKRSGLEAEFVQMNTSIQPQALINGNINFIPALSAGIPAAIAGMPLVVVMNFYSFTPWTLVTQNDINKPQDLLGKKIGVSGVRTTPHQLMTAWFKKYELNEKEVSYVFTGGTGGSFATLASAQVAGAVLVSPYDDKAVSKGFKKFMMIGDLLDIPTAGLIATRAELTNNRDRVQKTIAAVVDAIAWIRNNRPDTANMIAEKFKITPTEANGTYETLLSMLNKDGRLPLKVVHGYLDILRRERPIPADVDPQKFLDFSMLPGGK